VAVIVAFLVTLAVTPVAAGLARRLGVVDRPGPLKPQEHPVPYLGGVAVLAGLLGPVTAARPSVAVALGLAALLGLADDVADLDVRVRLVCELGVGVAVAAAAGLPLAVAGVAVALVVVMVNAVNLLDGLDALASSTVLASAAGFAVLLAGDGRAAALALCGALGGFLVWNRPPARVYLGDAGSYLLGTALAYLAASTVRDGEPVQVRAAAVLLLGVPVADMSVAIVRRWRARQPLLRGDRGHVYDQLVARGWSVEQTVAACATTQLVLAMIALGASELSPEGAVAVSATTVLAAGTWALATFAWQRSSRASPPEVGRDDQ
jgi:UDP-GlcNAc:undecaprenyl-phosphate GlcNAc-1-phosphate transferase